MKKNLYTKLVLIMLLLIISLMAVVGAFLTNEIRSYYLEDFYDKMKTVFEDPQLAADLPNAIDIDPKAIKAPVLTRQGWVCPLEQPREGAPR